MSLNTSVDVLTLSQAVASGTPLLLAATGELLAERSGVLNLGVEGMMLVGAVASFGATSATGNAWVGLAAGAAAAGAVSLVHAFLCITLRANQIVSGLALVVFGTGLASFMGQRLVGRPPGALFETKVIAGLGSLPVVGPVVFSHDLLVYLSWLVVAAAALYLSRTTPGLHVRAVGDSPRTADSLGIPVARYRYLHTAAGGVLAGMAGSYVALALTPSWSDNVTNGQGWIALALVIFAGWRPVGVLAGAYLFGYVLNLRFRLQVAGVRLPGQAFWLGALPYLATVAVLAVVSATTLRRRLGAPAALGLPFDREER